MEIYKSLTENGVQAYDIGKDNIRIKFQNGAEYLYTTFVTGRRNIEIMQTLARLGKGLTYFIKKNIREMYAARLD
jgi:hypothetical protein